MISEQNNVARVQRDESTEDRRQLWKMIENAASRAPQPRSDLGSGPRTTKHVISPKRGSLDR